MQAWIATPKLKIIINKLKTPIIASYRTIWDIKGICGIT